MAFRLAVLISQNLINGESVCLFFFRVSPKEFFLLRFVSRADKPIVEGEIRPKYKYVQMQNPSSLFAYHYVYSFIVYQ